MRIYLIILLIIITLFSTCFFVYYKSDNSSSHYQTYFDCADCSTLSNRISKLLPLTQGEIDVYPNYNSLDANYAYKIYSCSENKLGAFFDFEDYFYKKNVLKLDVNIYDDINTSKYGILSECSYNPSRDLNDLPRFTLDGKLIPLANVELALAKHILSKSDVNIIAYSNSNCYDCNSSIYAFLESIIDISPNTKYELIYDKNRLIYPSFEIYSDSNLFSIFSRYDGSKYVIESYDDFYYINKINPEIKPYFYNVPIDSSNMLVFLDSDDNISNYSDYFSDLNTSVYYITQDSNNDVIRLANLLFVNKLPSFFYKNQLIEGFDKKRFEGIVN